MDLALTADQTAIRETFADVFRREAGPERLREVVETGFDPRLWGTIAELGAVGIVVGEEHDGVGAGLLELVLVAEQAGARLACVPMVEAAIAARILAGRRADELARAITGERVVVFDPLPAVDGVCVLTPAGAVADAVVALDGDELVLAAGEAPPAAGDLGFRALADRPLDGDQVRRIVLAAGQDARAIWAQAHDEWLIATAALAVGLATEAIEIAVRYAAERIQFGVPIGSFQALQQPMADLITAAEGAELLAREAAWCCDRTLAEGRRRAPMAFAHATQTAERAAAHGLHVHGGYGYTLEYDIQFYLRRAKGLVLAAGDPELVWERVGAGALASTAAS